jgi:arginase family enzyme
MTRDKGPGTLAVIFPFDLFGSGGSGRGAALVGDELREILADNRRERVPTRAAAYTSRLRLREVLFDTLTDYQNWRSHGRRAIRHALRRNDFLLWITGNHLGALPLYDELAAAGGRCLVVQLDAHLDIHRFADCTPELSHGNFLLHCAGPLPPLLNIGHRDLLLQYGVRRKPGPGPDSSPGADPDALPCGAASVSGHGL